MEKVKDKLHLGHKGEHTSSTHQTTTATSHHAPAMAHGTTAMPIASAIPVGAVPVGAPMALPLAGTTDSRDLNRDGHLSAAERLKGATGSHTTGFQDSRDLNRDGHISTSEKLATGSHATGFQDSRDLNRDGHISTGERLAGATGSHGFHDEAARLKLHEEQLAISKREVGAGEVGIHKRVQEEHVQQSIPVKREEITVERRALTGAADPNARIASQDEIVRVPLYREEIVTEKRLVPTEEVIVRKKEVIDNQTVGATLRSEYVETVQTGTQQSSMTGGLHDARDTNRDGHVSMGEKLKGATGTHASGFDARDTNRDGHLSAGEKLSGAMGTQSRASGFDARDTNRDGHLSMGEKLSGAMGTQSNASGFDARDTNRDGHLSAGEKLKGAAMGAQPKAARG
jgi:uncharacterized protein (TIGR02271 family)